MKLIFLLLLLSVSQLTLAVTISEAVSRTEGMMSQAFVLGDRSTYHKKSNFFDQQKNYVLGEFSLDKWESTRAEQKVLEGVLAKLRAADEILRAQGGSFNQLSNVEPHGVFLLLEDFRVAPGSDLYPELRKVFDALLQKKWTHQDGVILSEDHKSVTMVKGGKSIESKAFDFAFSCSKRTAPAHCYFKDLGMIYVQQVK